MNEVMNKPFYTQNFKLSDSNYSIMRFCCFSLFYKTKYNIFEVRLWSDKTRHLSLVWKTPQKSVNIFQYILVFQTKKLIGKIISLKWWWMYLLQSEWLIKINTLRLIFLNMECLLQFQNVHLGKQTIYLAF